MKTLQKELEIKFNKNQLISKLTRLVQNQQEIAELIFNHDLDVMIAEQLCVNLIIHKRMDIPTTIGTLFYIYKDSQFTANEVIKCVNAGLCFIDTEKEQLIVKFNVDQRTQDELDSFQFPLPLVCEPRKLEKNNQNGYFIADTGSLVLNSRTPKYDINLQHLNRANSVALGINSKIAVMANELNTYDPENEDYRDISEKNWAKFTEHSRNTSLWFSDKSFWLTHKYDKRGRIYDVGYFVNPQGNDYHKASIELAHKEVVNF